MKMIKNMTMAAGALILTTGLAVADDSKMHDQLHTYNESEIHTDGDVDIHVDVPYGNAQIDTFAEADMNNDGAVVFEEFQVFAQLDNEYNQFITLDKNKDKRLTKSEFYSIDEAKDNYDEQ